MKTVEICYRDKNTGDAIVALDAGYSKEEIEELLSKNPSWYRSTMEV